MTVENDCRQLVRPKERDGEGLAILELYQRWEIKTDYPGLRERPLAAHEYKYCRAHKILVSGHGVRLNIYLLVQVEHELLQSVLFATDY